MSVRLTKSDVAFLTSLEKGRCVFYKDLRSSFTGEIKSVEHSEATGMTNIAIEHITDATGKFDGRESVVLNLSKWGHMTYSDSGATYHCHSTRSTVTFATDGC